MNLSRPVRPDQRQFPIEMETTMHTTTQTKQNKRITMPQIIEQVAISFACGAEIPRLAERYAVPPNSILEAIRDYMNADDRTKPPSNAKVIQMPKKSTLYPPLRRAA